jgi:carbon monoxide dehydrogenase subunit G
VELTNEFRVNVPVDDAWAVLTDVERIAPAMPGAQLQEVEGDEYRGIVKVKVGPITAQYKGTARFQEQDKEAHRVVLRAEGRDTRGQGNASATVTATLTPDGDGTKVAVVTDLTITGKVAQFGRGVLADVSSKLLGQFVDNLERDVLAGPTGGNGSAPATPAAGAPAETPASGAPAEAPAGATTGTAAAVDEGEPPTSRRIDHPEPEPVDLLQTAGQPVAKRVVPLVGGLLAVFVIWRVLARRKR